MINKLEMIEQLKVLIENHEPEHLKYDLELYDHKKCFLNAEKFINCLPENIFKPYISISDDGEIILFWKTENGFLDLSIFEQTISYYGEFDNTEIVCEDVFKIKLPSEVLNHLEIS